MYLGLDIGTSSVKGVLVSETFDVVGTQSAQLDVSRPFSGWSEQDPQDWIVASEKVIQSLKSRHPREFEALQSIGLSGQMHGAVLLDADDEVLRPCILWNDSRSHIECTELEGMGAFRKIGGNIVMPGFTAPKLRWVEKNEPEIFRKICKVLLPKDFIRFWLTGEHVAEMSDAAGTLWLDVERRCWSDDLLKITGLTRDAMPRLVEGTEKSGALRPELATRWGLSNVPVAGGGGDNASTACGLGIVQPGTGFLSLGTSGVLFAACDAYSPNTAEAVHTFCHALPETWHHMGVVLSAVDSLTWLGKVTGHAAPALTGLLPVEIERPSKTLFLPYLCGERTPHNFPHAVGSFTNLSMNADLPELVQAVLEGVGFAFEDCNQALAKAGTTIEEAFVVGGGARSEQWLQILASITGIELLIPSDGDFGAAFGAAKLGMACLGQTSLERVIVRPKVDRRVEPQSALVQAYEEKRQAFLEFSKSARNHASNWN